MIKHAYKKLRWYFGKWYQYSDCSCVLLEIIMLDIAKSCGTKIQIRARVRIWCQSKFLAVRHEHSKRTRAYHKVLPSCVLKNWTERHECPVGRPAIFFSVWFHSNFLFAHTSAFGSRLDPVTLESSADRSDFNLPDEIAPSDIDPRYFISFPNWNSPSDE